MGSPDSIGNPTILFDGVCNLCTGSVIFIIRRDPEAYFRFAALQSTFGQSILKERNLDPERLRSIVLIRGENVYERSRAVLEIAKQLNWPWPLFYVFVLVPGFIRNLLYDLIGRYRYRLFGRKDECMIPTPELKARFID